MTGTSSSSIIPLIILLSSAAWQTCWGLSCYTCTTLVDNGVTKPGSQTCDLFASAGDQERSQRFVEVCPAGVKACSHSEKRGFVGQSSGSSYDIIQKGCYGRSFINTARFNTCEDVGGGSGSSGKTERLCLCDTDLCLMDPEVKVEDGSKSDADAPFTRVAPIAIFTIFFIFTLVPSLRF